jgi:phosphoglycerate kinase
MKLNSISKLKKLEGKRVLLRVDFNIPISKSGRVGSGADGRLKAAMPTIEHLQKAGAKVIAVSHLGRPKRRNPQDSLKPVVRHLGRLLGQKVHFIDANLTKEGDAEKQLARVGNGQLAVLENIRFYPGEEKNDPKLAKRLASLADIYVSDAFGTCHRAHASTVGVTNHLPSYAGFLVENEVKNLSRLLEKPKKPFVVLMGGAKISSKLPTLKNLLKIADTVMLGGGMANAFFKARGCNIGKSKVAPEDIKFAKQHLKDKKLMVPTDVLCASSLTEKAQVRYARDSECGKNDYLVDAGPETVRAYAEKIKKAKTLIWNGPVGIFEIKKFSHGTMSLGRLVAARSKGKAFGAVGGGETVMALERTGMAEWVDHVSTGGGAMLEFLSGKVLPGIKPLIKK